MELRQSNFPVRYSVGWTKLLRQHVIELIGDGSQSAIARKIGVNPTIISQLLNTRYVSNKMLEVIANGTNFHDEKYINKPEKSITVENTRYREVPSGAPESKPSQPTNHDNDADIRAIEKYVYSRKSAAALIPELRPKMMEILIRDLLSDFNQLNPNQLC